MTEPTENEELKKSGQSAPGDQQPCYVDADYIPKITITGAGILRISSCELMKTKNAERQLSALKKLRMNKYFLKAT